jgi:3-methyladenine DNA glycosylase AlkD
MEDLLRQIRIELQNSSDEKTRESSKRFFREEVMPFGVKSARVTQISKMYFARIMNKSKAEIYQVCDELFQSGYLEESFIACNFSYYVKKEYQPGDFRIFEQWLNQYITNWATCDTFCNHTMGEFLQMYPEFIQQLKEFTMSSNRWLRRAAAVSLIVPARKGKFLHDILEIADMLLPDKDDMVQKGYGWMLKVASECHQKEVFDFVMLNKLVMPRTALRYAIEKMPAELKAAAMSKI